MLLVGIRYNHARHHSTLVIGSLTTKILDLDHREWEEKRPYIDL